MFICTDPVVDLVCFSQGRKNKSNVSPCTSQELTTRELCVGPVTQSRERRIATLMQANETKQITEGRKLVSIFAPYGAGKGRAVTVMMWWGPRELVPMSAFLLLTYVICGLNKQYYNICWCDGNCFVCMQTEASVAMAGNKGPGRCHWASHTQCPGQNLYWQQQQPRKISQVKLLSFIIIAVAG